MAKKSIAVNSQISKIMHRPTTTSGYVLYTKQKSYNGELEGGAISSKAATDPEYVRKSENNYNSPTNIRRLFITGKGVAVQYYTGPQLAGKRGPLWNHKTVEVDLFDVANKIMNYSSEHSKYLMQKTIDAKAVAPDQYSTSGNGIGVVSNPYVCSNIEEVYFDWTLLMSADAAPYFQGMLNTNTYAAFLNKATSFSESKNENIIRFFEAFNSGGTKDIRKRFPRLRIVAMISNLDDIINHPSMKKSGLNMIDEVQSTESWYKANKELIQASNSIVWIGDLSQGLNNPNTEFVVKSQQYKFDYEILDAFVKSYISKIDNIKRQQKYGNTAEAKVEEALEMSDVETKLVEIEKSLVNTGISINSVIQYAALGGGVPKAELEKIVRQFTKPNRERFAKALGINI